jgi:hypothetical protein
MGFFASKTLLSAVELGLFTELAKRPMNAGEISEALGLHPRAVPDFPDALVALKFLEREGEGQAPSTTIRPKRQFFWIATARTISAASWRCRTPGFTGSGPISPKH